MQKAVDDPVWGPRNNPEAESSILQLLALWRAAGDPVTEEIIENGNGEHQ